MHILLPKLAIVWPLMVLALLSGCASRGRFKDEMRALPWYEDRSESWYQDKAKRDLYYRYNRRFREALVSGDGVNVRSLLGLGFDPNWRLLHDSAPRNALYIAAYEDHAHLIDALVDAGARPDDDGLGKWSPLMMAAAAGHLGVAKRLIARGAHVNFVATSGETPLIVACCYTCGIVPLDHPVTWHHPFPKLTPEEAAREKVKIARAHRNQLKFIKYLVRRAANVNAVSNEGDSPLGIAKATDWHEAVRVLKRAGATNESFADPLRSLPYGGDGGVKP